jgi:hypothetical protein
MARVIARQRSLVAIVVVAVMMVMMIMAAWLGFCYTADKHHTHRGKHYTAGKSGQRRHHKFSDKKRTRLKIELQSLC